METKTGVNLNAEALKNGITWGVINIVIFLVTWYTMPSLMSSTIYGVITILIGIALAVFFCLDLRKKAGGYWTFGEALWKIFAMFITAAAIVFIFTILFGKFIDTTYPDKMKELTIAKTEETFKSIGMEGEAVDKALADVDASFEKQFNPTFSQAVVSFGIVAIMYFIGALIFALIFKKTNPNPWSTAEDQDEIVTS
jgi:hypothetical protein